MAIEDDIDNFMVQYVCPWSGETIAGVPNIAITGGLAALGFLLMKGKGMGLIIGATGAAATGAIGYAKYYRNLCI